MSSINIYMPFLNDLDELEFLEEFAGRPFVSEQEFIDAFLSLDSARSASPDENNGSIDNHTVSVNNHTGLINHNTGPINYNAGAVNNYIGPINYHTGTMNHYAAPMPNNYAGPMPNHTGTMNGQSSVNTVQTPVTGPYKKACKECARRKMKCVIIAGTNPQQCEACQKRGSLCEFERKM